MSTKNASNTVQNEYRWAVEFLAGPAGYLEKAELVSDWFPNIDDAKMDAYNKVEKEVNEYPFSRGKILKLLVEDKNGKIIELSNVKDIPVR